MGIAATPAYADTVDEVKSEDILCFGIPDETSGFDGKWIVLDPSHTSTGEEGMFLLSLNLVGDSNGNPLLFRNIGDVSVSFSDRGETFAQTHPGCTDYQGSDIQRWCMGFPAQYLTKAEEQALIPTFQSDTGISIQGFGIPLPGASNGTVDFDPAEGILQGDTIFLLSVEEVCSADYGFVDNRSRVALYKGTSAGYWLRSPHIPTFPLDVGFVFTFGAVMDYPVNAQAMFPMETYARPACNLDRARITYLEKLGGNDTTTIWRVNFQDGNQNEQEYDLTIPEIGEVLDIQGLIKTVVMTIALILVALIVLITWLILKRRKKRRVQSIKKDI